MQAIHLKIKKRRGSTKNNGKKSLDYSYCLYMPKGFRPSTKTRRQSKTFVKEGFKEKFRFKESVSSTRDHSAKRSITPGTQSLASNRINSVNLKNKNLEEVCADLNRKAHRNLRKIPESIVKKVKKIRGNTENMDISRTSQKSFVSNSGAYGSPRPCSTSFKHRSTENHNRARLMDITKFFEEFHEKSKNLLMKFEKNFKEKNVL